MTILYLIMISVFIAYILFITNKYGIQPSISASYYSLPDKQKPLFTFFCWGFALPAMIVGSSGIMFLAGAGILLVGAAAAFKQSQTETVHITSAVVGITASQIAIMFQYGLPILNIIFLATAVIILISNTKNSVWWIEVAAFLSICAALGLNL